MTTRRKVSVIYPGNQYEDVMMQTLLVRSSLLNIDANNLTIQGDGTAVESVEGKDRCLDIRNGLLLAFT